MVKDITCDLCKATFRQKTSIYRHMRLSHKIAMITTPTYGLTCPLCGSSLFRQKNFREHLLTDHNIQMMKEELIFSTLTDFLKWKADVQFETSSNYVMHTGRKKLSKNIKKSYYFCHRGGYYKDKVEKRQRYMKKESCKIQSSCPSLIELTETGNQFSVTYYKTHVGHSVTKQENVIVELSECKPTFQLIECFNLKDELVEKCKHSLEMISSKELDNNTIAEANVLLDKLLVTLQADKGLTGEKKEILFVHSGYDHVY